MDKKYLTSFLQGNPNIYPKPSPVKKPAQNSQNKISFNTPSSQKYIPDEQSSKLILNYFQFNNFQDFNTWQQIAKTKTDYKFEEISGQKIECQLLFKWQANDRENFTIKTEAKNKKNAKKKALVQLLETLMSKGFISYGFKEKNFLQKLPRRKKYESSSSEEETEIFEANHIKRATLFSFMKDNHIQAVIEALNLDNVKFSITPKILEVWNWALSKKSFRLIEKMLSKLFGQVTQSDSIDAESNTHKTSNNSGLKQVSYVEQSKDPFQEDLTVFIRYYQIQRTKYQQKDFNLLPMKKERYVEMNLPSEELIGKLQKGFSFEAFKEFSTIESVSEVLVKRSSCKNHTKTKHGFFDDLKEVNLPKFEEDIQEKKVLSIKIIEKMLHHTFYTSQDYEFSLKIIEVFFKSLENIDFLNKFVKKTEIHQNYQKEQSVNTKAQKYYKQMKQNLLTQMLYNFRFKMSQQNLNKSISIEGMLNLASSQSKYDGIFQFVSRQPEEIITKKIHKKSNFSQFSEQYQFCIDDLVLLVNKINQKTYLGLIKQLSQSFKIYVSFLVFESQMDFPVPVTVYKVLNTKLYNKISSALIHTCKHYINQVDYEIGRGKNVTLIYQSPSGPHLELIQEMLSEFIAQNLFVLIVSENYELLGKFLSQKGFRCIKISPNSQQKMVSKNNIILTNQLNVCTDSIKSIAFDRVIIDEAHRIPQIISLLSIVKCTRKLYLIGDPNLPRNEMRSPLSKLHNVEKSLFEKYIYHDAPYIFMKQHFFNKITEQQQSKTNQKSSHIFDHSIVTWLKNSIYNSSIITDLQQPIKKTPLIKGFNWPSNQYRVCFIHVSQTSAKQLSSERIINEECFLITWIIAEVLKSGFTQLEQITCCCMDSTIIPILQKHLFKILQKLNIQPLQWQKIFQHLIKSLTGSIWGKNELVIVLAETLFMNDGRNDNLEEVKKNDDMEMGKKLTAALLQAERGLIIVGDLNRLKEKSLVWSNFIDWMAANKLILSYGFPK